MKLRLFVRNECPPEGGGLMGFRYTHAQDGHISHSLDEDSWMKAIDKHCADNGYPQVSKEDAIDQLCQSLPPGWCVYENGEKPKWFVDTRLRVSDVLRGTKVLASFMIQGLLQGVPVVPKELVSSRSATCARCFFNVKTSGCAPCVGLSDLVGKIGGAIKTPSDASLRSCAVCRCSVRAKTRLPINLISKFETPETLERYPSFCWVKNEIEVDTAKLRE